MNQGDSLIDAFAGEYRRSPQWIVRAPGRVNLIGEYTDINEGFVLPMAIERDVMIAAASHHSRLIRIRSSCAADSMTIDLSQPVHADPPGSWSNYPRGVVAEFLARGIDPPGLDVFVQSNLPLGIGLSSSAALEVAMATLLEAVTGAALDRLDKALLCQRAEQRFAGVPCGIMDPFISIFARPDQLLLLDCRSHRAQEITFAEPSVSILIFSTNVKHQLARSEYPLRRAQCADAAQELGVESLRDVAPERLRERQLDLKPVNLKRARHVVTEMARIQQAAAAVREARWSDAGALMYASHESLRTDFEVSCSELDAAVDIARNIGLSGGVYGSRMTGGGFGGCAIALIKTEAAERIGGQLRDEYGERVGIIPTLFTSRPAAGAAVLYP